MKSAKKDYSSEAEKLRFYELAAKRYKAERRMKRLTAIIHIENKNDEVFWGKVTRYAYPQGRFHFISASRSMNGYMTSGCTQALKYRPFLDEGFWIAIDSDYRYLSEEPEMNACNYVLQTYTYSFENHFCFPQNLQRAFHESCPYAPPFDFGIFLDEYSHTIYPLLVWQLYLQSIDPLLFPKHIFHRLLTLPIGARSLANNGDSIIQVLKDRTRKMLRHFKRVYPDADNTWYEARCNTLGVTRQNAYLFVRGHQLYDCICEQGKKLYNLSKKANPDKKPSKHFEQALTEHLCFGEYAEIKKVVEDIHLALGLITKVPQAIAHTDEADACHIVPTNDKESHNTCTLQ